MKVENALKQIKKCSNKKFYLGHSGGKDSAVILHLALQVFKPEDIVIIHNVKPLYEDKPKGKTDTHIETLKYLYEYVIPQVKEVIFITPNKMEDTLKFHNLDCQIDGTRIEENNRVDKSATFIENGVEKSRKELKPFVETGLFGISFCYPIYDWTDDDVYNYIKDNKIKISKEYLRDEKFKDLV